MFFRGKGEPYGRDPQAVIQGPGWAAGDWAYGGQGKFGVWLYDMVAGAQRCALEWPAVKLPADLQPALAFSPLGNRLARGLGSVARVWNGADGAAHIRRKINEIICEYT